MPSVGRLALLLALSSALGNRKDHIDMQLQVASDGAVQRVRAIPLAEVLTNLANKQQLAEAALAKFHHMSDVAQKLAVIIETLGNTQVAVTDGREAMEALGVKLASAKSDVEREKLEPLFDGQFTADDLQSIGKTDTLLGIIREFLSTATDLATLSTLLEGVARVLSEALDLGDSVAELAGARGAVSIESVRDLSTQAAGLMVHCRTKVEDLSQVEKDLSPVLDKWGEAGTFKKGIIVTTNFNTLQRGFDGLGASWSDINGFYIGSLQPLLEQIALKVGELKAAMESYQIPSADTMVSPSTSKSKRRLHIPGFKAAAAIIKRGKLPSLHGWSHDEHHPNEMHEEHQTHHGDEEHHEHTESGGDNDDHEGESNEEHHPNETHEEHKKHDADKEHLERNEIGKHVEAGKNGTSGEDGKRRSMGERLKDHLNKVHNKVKDHFKNRGWGWR